MDLNTEVSVVNNTKIPLLDSSRKINWPVNNQENLQHSVSAKQGINEVR